MSMVPMPMLTCTSVPASSHWYQKVLGLVSVHGGDEYDQLATVGPDGPTTVLQLHRRGTREHPFLSDSAKPLGGNGIAVWFETTGYRGVLQTMRDATAGGVDVTVLEDDHVNPTANHRELWLRDPDGYLVVVSSPYGDT
jgi:catechol 2,3-dioxygenase-like lactoylglutathione lyase family enzyme